MTSKEAVNEVVEKVAKSKRLGKGTPFTRKIETPNDIKKCVACGIRQILKEGKSDRYGILSSLANSFLGACKAETEERDTKEILKRLKEMERS